MLTKSRLFVRLTNVWEMATKGRMSLRSATWTYVWRCLQYLTFFRTHLVINGLLLKMSEMWKRNFKGKATTPSELISTLWLCKKRAIIQFYSINVRMLGNKVVTTDNGTSGGNRRYDRVRLLQGRILSRYTDQVHEWCLYSVSAANNFLHLITSADMGARF